VNDVADASLYRAYLVRVVEERLLRLFSEGKLAGTTHTCIGQELSAVALADSLDRERDIIFSNHRCHGHYLAWTDDVEGLLAEVMGKESGVCGGIGGSQHLCGRHFFSNGIQGGIVPVSAGLAFAHKLAGDGGIVAVCIGDGTLGEGAVYEAFNIAAKWRLPLLVMLEGLVAGFEKYHTKEELQPDEGFLKSIEEQIAIIGSAAEGFRQEVIAYLWAASRRGERVSYRSYEPLKEAIEKKLMTSVRDISRIITKARTRDEEQTAKYNAMVKNLLDSGYCESCVDVVLKYAANNLWKD